jgi:ACGX-repeat protein
MCLLVIEFSGRYTWHVNKNEKEFLRIERQEEQIMALSNLFGWNKEAKNQAPAACGTACGAGEKPAEKPAACGTACGAGDKPAEAPAACGAADKPSSCGSACGASDK